MQYALQRNEHEMGQKPTPTAAHWHGPPPAGALLPPRALLPPLGKAPHLIQARDSANNFGLQLLCLLYQAARASKWVAAGLLPCLPPHGARSVRGRCAAARIAVRLLIRSFRHRLPPLSRECAPLAVRSAGPLPVLPLSNRTQTAPSPRGPSGGPSRIWGPSSGNGRAPPFGLSHLHLWRGVEQYD